jgi:hypothetical protein
MTVFYYSSNIPNPPNDPADDVGTMQSNAASIAGIIAVDHVEFGVEGNGQHNQVTFNANNTPTVPTTPPVLFTKTVGALPQLFFYSGSEAKGSNQYYISSAGGGTGQTESSTFLLGGLVLKTGTVQVTNGPVAVNFVIAFPNACLTVTAQPINAGGPTVANDYVYVSSVGSSATFNATATQRTAKANNTVTFYYTAIGY